MKGGSDRYLCLGEFRIIYRKYDGNLSMQAGKDERFRSESKKKTIFGRFNFEMGNIGL